MSINRTVTFTIVFICTGLITVIGGVLLAYGIVEATDRGKIAAELSLTFALCVANIVTGGVIILITAFGWFGACLNNEFALLFFACIILIIAVFLLITCIGAFCSFNAIKEKVLPSFKQSIEKKYARYTVDHGAQDEINDMQAYFGCCGVMKPIAFGGVFPLSCCKVKDNSVCIKPYPEGCYTVIARYAENKLQNTLIVGLCGAGIKVLGGTFAIILYNIINVRYN